MRQLTYPSGFVYGSCLTVMGNMTHTPANTNWADITGLTHEVKSGAKMHFRFEGYTGHDSGSSRSERISPNFTGTATGISYFKRMRVVGASTETALNLMTAWQDVSDRSHAAANFIWHTIIGEFTSTSDGVFSMQVAKGSAASYNLFVYGGANLQILPLAG